MSTCAAGRRLHQRPLPLSPLHLPAPPASSCWRGDEPLGAALGGCRLGLNFCSELLGFLPRPGGRVYRLRSAEPHFTWKFPPAAELHRTRRAGADSRRTWSGFRRRPSPEEGTSSGRTGTRTTFKGAPEAGPGPSERFSSGSDG